MNPVFLGLDAGGSGTRAVVIDLDGHILGTGRAAAANPQVRSPGEVSAALEQAARQALAGTTPAAVAGGAVGMSGLAAAARSEVRAAIDTAWDRAGLNCPMRIVGDAVTGFASATAEPDGTVIIAGTGAVVAELRDRSVTRTVDGLGWLLGDAGSGFWLGLAAARHTARQLTAMGPHTVLTAAVSGHFGVREPEEFITACYRRPRENLAGLAPVVCECARAGDPAALGIVAEAARRLAEGFVALRPSGGPVVLTGGLLANPTPVRDRLERALFDEHGVRARIAADAALGAAWLAAETTGGGAELHRRLFSPPKR